MLVCFFGLWAACAVAQDTYAVTGTIVASTGVIESGTMLVSGGKIAAVGEKVDVPAGTKVIAVEGVVFPGLIDLHNHLTWNVLPRWKLATPVGTRYDWQAMPEYGVKLSGPQGKMTQAGYGCDMERYAEVKALLNGATSITGTGRLGDCVKGLARNLDVASGLYGDQANGEPLRYEVFPMEIPFDVAKGIRDSLESKALRAVLFHVGEGKDASAAREFRMFKARGFLRPGVTIIHGVGLSAPNFVEMAAAGVGLVWSPRSNLELYGKTLDVAAAMKAGVTLALAPDWSPTGSAGMLEELQVALAWNKSNGNFLSDTDLFKMMTANPAKLAAAADQIGAIAPGMRADFIVLPRRSKSALNALLDSKPGSIELVVVGGAFLAGSGKFLSKGEKVSVCGNDKVLQVADWFSLTERLQKALRGFGSELAGLSECGQ